MDIVKALEDRASSLRSELDKVQRAIQAMAGTKTPGRMRQKFRHTAATKRKLRLAQQEIWARRRQK